jgi:hypothetical protein
LPGFPISFQNVIQRTNGSVGVHLPHDLFDHPWDRGKRQAMIQEGLDRDLIRGVQNAGNHPSLRQGMACQIKAGKSPSVGLCKMKLARGYEIKS